jgi:hypothetical protein
VQEEDGDLRGGPLLQLRQAIGGEGMAAFYDSWAGREEELVATLTTVRSWSSTTSANLVGAVRWTSASPRQPQSGSWSQGRP